jgi:hypothetical protein
MKPKHPPGKPMTLGNMRKLGRRIVRCHVGAVYSVTSVTPATASITYRVLGPWAHDAALDPFFPDQGVYP